MKDKDFEYINKAYRKDFKAGLQVTALGKVGVLSYGDSHCWVKIEGKVLPFHPGDVELVEEPKDEYYIRDARQIGSDSCLWWGKNSKGYTFDLKKAGVYTKAEVIAIVKASSDDHRGYLKEEVD